MVQLPTSVPLYAMFSTTPGSPGSLPSRSFKFSTDHSPSDNLSDDDDDLDLLVGDNEARGLVNRLQKHHHWIFARRRNCPRALHHVGRFSLVVLRELVPSFLHRYLPKEDHTTGQRYQSISNTTNTNSHVAISPAKKLAALDGIRGVACLIVFNFHFLYPYSRTITRGFMGGSTGDHYENVNFHQLPFVCLLHRGRAAVCIFFAVSGYVLSYRFLQLIRERLSAKAHAGLSSLAFRRGLRLYLPPTISLICIAFTAWLGAFDRGARLSGSLWTAGGEWEPHPNYRSDFKDAWLTFYNTWWFWADPMTWESRYIEYDPHLWTIPIEMRSSMVLFLALLATAPLRPLWRVLTLSLSCAYCLSAGRWDVGVFLGGAIVAEFHLIFSSLPHITTTSPISPQPTDETRHLWHSEIDVSRSSGSNAVVALPPTPTSSPSLRPSMPYNDGPDQETHKPMLTPGSPSLSSRLPSVSSILDKARRSLRPYHTPLLVLCLILSLFMLSFPDAQPESTPGFRWLAEAVTPRAFNNWRYYFWHSLGSILFIFTLPLLPRLSHFCFETSVPQYLGRISYALYLCHGPIMHSLGFEVQPWIWRHVAGVEYIPGEGGDGGKPGTWTGGTWGWCVGLLAGWMFMLVVVIVVADVFWRYVDVGCVKIARAVEGRMVSPAAGKDAALELGGAGLPMHRMSR